MTVDLCYVYVMGSGRGILKVGISRNPVSRLLTVSFHWPDITRVHMAWGMSASDAALIERIVHRMLAPCNSEREIFRTSEDKAVEAITAAMAFLGIEPVPFGAPGFTLPSKRNVLARDERISERRTTNILIRVSPGLKEQAEEIAANERRTLSAWIEGLILDAVEQRRGRKAREQVTDQHQAA